jgi:hypothetical protein
VGGDAVDPGGKFSASGAAFCADCGLNIPVEGCFRLPPTGWATIDTASSAMLFNPMTSSILCARMHTSSARLNLNLLFGAALSVPHVTDQDCRANTQCQCSDAAKAQ